MLGEKSKIKMNRLEEKSNDELIDRESRLLEEDSDGHRRLSSTTENGPLCKHWI